jgi:phenylpyruvate tautomerase PptA (4-oxalocrotonate tautomerase family)
MKEVNVETTPQDLEKLKADIIKKCTREILEKLKEQQER